MTPETMASGRIKPVAGRSPQKTESPLPTFAALKPLLKNDKKTMQKMHIGHAEGLTPKHLQDNAHAPKSSLVAGD